MPEAIYVIADRGFTGSTVVTLVRDSFTLHNFLFKQPGIHFRCLE